MGTVIDLITRLPVEIAPAMFVSHLKRKAVSVTGPAFGETNAGVKVVEFSTRKTKLSSSCQCGRVKKKKLSQRVHECECEVRMQRDLYSAYLAKFVDPEEEILHADLAQLRWSSEEHLLHAAWSSALGVDSQLASRRRVPSSFGKSSQIKDDPSRVRASRSRTEDLKDTKTGNVVGNAESPREVSRPLWAVRGTS